MQFIAVPDLSSLFLVLLCCCYTASGYENVYITANSSSQFCTPPNNLQMPCFTIVHCFRNVPGCVFENTNLHFAPGLHSTAGLSGLVSVVNISNVSLLGRNSRIECEEGVGFLLKEMNNLQIYGLRFLDCGAVLSKSLVEELFPSQCFRVFFGVQSSVVIANSYNVNVTSINISNGNGFGLFAVNWLGQSVLRDSIISHSNRRSVHQFEHDFSLCIDPDNTNCSGGGLVLIYDRCSMCSSGTHQLDITGMVVEYCANLQNWDVFSNTEPAGGFTISLWQKNLFSVEITIRDSVFDSNTGVYAGNAAMNFQYGSNFHIMFMNTSFLNGNPEIAYYRDKSKSGGLYCHWQQSMTGDRTSYIKVLVVDNCTFSKNSGLEGGALHIISIIDDAILEPTVLRMIINRVNIEQNRGHMGIMRVQEDRTEESSVPTNFLLVSINSTRIYENSPLNPGSATIRQFTQSNIINSSLSIRNIRGLILADIIITDNKMRGLDAFSVTSFSFVGSSYINANIADNGGGIRLDQSTFLLLRESYLYVTNNRATMHGGGIFIKAADTRSTSNRCFFDICDITNITKPMVIVRNNYADLSGNSIYGGDLDRCQFDDALSVSGYDAFNRSFEIPFNRSLTEVTSTIHQLCFCSNEEPQCGLKSQKVSIFPGQSFFIPVVAVGQLDGTTTDTAVSYLVNSTGSSSVFLGSQQKAQNLLTNCTQLEYSLSSMESEVSFIGVQTNYGRTRLPNSILLLIEVHTEPCPLGFTLNQQKSTCDCSNFLIRYSVKCFINEDHNNIQRSAPTWIGYSEDRDSLLAHDSCPLSYCTSDNVNLSLINGTDLQCQSGHSGILCGGCEKHLSVTFGSQACRRCSNRYISLIITFFLAGLLLVAIMIYGNLTISQGTFNGLLFYANIVRVHHSILFPPNHVNVITVFIAWLNLDLGFEACFYDGMDAYSRVWLQYVFPAYVWLLVASIIIIGNYSKFAAKLFGSNAIQVLATLLLLSYTKIQRIILETWSSTFIRYTNGSFHVWVLDGNIMFLEGKHIVLCLMSVIAILGFIIPFTVVLLCEYPLQLKFSTAMLRYKLIPLIDAYQGPYKKQFRWWSGTMLLLRGVLLTIFGLNLFGDPRLNLEIILSVCVILLGLMWNAGTIYKDRYINMLESFYIVNLGLLSGWTAYNRFSSTKHFVYQMAISYTLVGASFAVFILTIGVQLFLSLKEQCLAKISCLNRRPTEQELPVEQYVSKLRQPSNNMAGSALREPLIDDM